MRLGTKEETRAVAACVVVLALGVALGFHKPAWLGRAGALIIIIGVLLGASRLPEAVRGRLRALTSTIPEEVERAMAQVEKSRGTKLDEKQRSASQKKLHAEVEAELNRGVDRWEKQFRRYELVMVVGGTFINGFGEYLMLAGRTLNLDQ